MFPEFLIFQFWDVSKPGVRLETAAPFQTEHNCHGLLYKFYKINIELQSCQLARNTIPYKNASVYIGLFISMSYPGNS